MTKPSSQTKKIHFKQILGDLGKFLSDLISLEPIVKEKQKRQQQNIEHQFATQTKKKTTKKEN